jgi:hypothetical protein
VLLVEIGEREYGGDMLGLDSCQHDSMNVKVELGCSAAIEALV